MYSHKTFVDNVIGNNFTPKSIWSYVRLKIDNSCDPTLAMPVFEATDIPISELYM